LGVKSCFAACCVVAFALALQVEEVPAQQPQAKGPMHKGKRQGKPKVEKLACRLGTEDEHARIAVELHDGKVNRFAYYSKWKPRTCSMDVVRNDAYSKWVDTGNVTVVTLVDDTGAFLIDHERDRYKFLFREIDRMRYCGMEGKVSGTLTIFRGKPQCLLEGVMERDGSEKKDDGKPGAQAPHHPAEAAIAAPAVAPPAKDAPAATKPAGTTN
jgi:hypothetical protein